MLPIFQKPNTVLFKGLPPILKGTTLFADGIPNYLLTVDQAINDFYTKSQSDTLFLKLAGGIMTGNIFFKKIIMGGDLGLYWKSIDDNLVASLKGGSNGFELEYRDPTNPSNNYSFLISPNFIGPSKDMGKPSDTSEEFIQAKYVVRKNFSGGGEHDIINLNNGYYIYKGPGWIYFTGRGGEEEILGTFEIFDDNNNTKFIISLLGPLEGNHGHILANTPDINNLNDNYVLVNKLFLKNNYLPLNLNENKTGSLNDNVVELKNGIWKFTRTHEDGNSLIIDASTNHEQGIFDASQWFTQLGTVQGGTWISRPTGPTLSPDTSLSFAQIGHVNAVGTKYDAIVKSGTVNNSLGEYNTVRAAVLAGKKSILIKAGTYSASSFWPISTDTVGSNILIEGEFNVSITGPSVVSPGTARTISGWKFKNITFKLLDNNYQNQCVFSFDDGQANYGGYNSIEFEDCTFDGYAISNGNLGFNLYILNSAPAAKFKNCLFTNLDVAVRSTKRYEVSKTWHHDYATGYHFDECRFSNLNKAIIPFYFAKWKIENCEFNDINFIAIDCWSSESYSGFEYQGRGRAGLDIIGNHVADTVKCFINLNHGGNRKNWNKYLWELSSSVIRGKVIGESAYDGNPNLSNKVYFYVTDGSNINGIYRIDNLTKPNIPTFIIGLDKPIYALKVVSNTNILTIPYNTITTDGGNQVPPLYGFNYENGSWGLKTIWIHDDSMVGNSIRHLESGLFIDPNNPNKKSVAIAWTQESQNSTGVFGFWYDDPNPNNSRWIIYSMVDNIRPYINSITYTLFPNETNPVDTYVFIAAGKKNNNTGGVFYKKLSDTINNNLYFYRSLMKTEDLNSSFDDVNYVKCITHDDDGHDVTYLYVNVVNVVDNFSKIYRGKVTDVINSSSGGSEPWELYYTFPDNTWVVKDMLAYSNPSKPNKFYIATSRGILYCDADKNKPKKYIGPGNITDLWSSSSLTSPYLAIFNKGLDDMTEKAIICGLFGGNKFRIMSNSLLNNPDEIYDNYKRGVLNIINNDVSNQIFLNTYLPACVESDPEEMAFGSHNVTIIGNKKDGAVGITEGEHSSDNIVTKYILGHMKKENGQPPGEEDFSKSNILNLNSSDNDY